MLMIGGCPRTPSKRWMSSISAKAAVADPGLCPADPERTGCRSLLSAVVDASVLVAALLDSGPHGQWAEGIVAAGSLHAPEVARAETANILRRLERAKELTTAEANAAYEDLIQLNMELLYFEPFAERIWELRHDITCYDAWYVAIAEALKLPLATLDERLAKTEETTCDFLTPRTA
jgi:predicted nucleic acid-binding protein